MADPDPNALVQAVLDAARRRRRWSFALAVTPLLVAGAGLGVLELGYEGLAVPVGAVGAVLVLVELVAAIEAGLAVNRAVAKLAELTSGREPP